MVVAKTSSTAQEEPESYDDVSYLSHKVFALIGLILSHVLVWRDTCDVDLCM